jgi:thiamine-monophosphate kinase
MSDLSVSKVGSLQDFGEKAVIAELLRPLFNANNDPNGVGDDCAALAIPAGALALFSTDRVPADLFSFRAGILDYFGLGRYLAVLNISDIAACGGKPLGLLLNFGLPAGLEIEQLLSICKGALSIVEACNAKVLGGDLSASCELSLSATAIGYVDSKQILRRSGACDGDSVFISRDLGITPIALRYCQNPRAFEGYAPHDISALQHQFTSLGPMLDLAAKLSASGECTSAMDNTDGVWQSLHELATESRVQAVVDSESLAIPRLVKKYADENGEDPIQLAFSAGADFSLVGTLKGSWTSAQATEMFGENVCIIGTCRAADKASVILKTGKTFSELRDPGWNYFTSDADDKHSRL